MREEASESDDGPAAPGSGAGGGDPVVIASLALGWEMADLYAGRRLDDAVPELPETLPGIGPMTSRQTVHASLLRMRGLIRRVLEPAAADTITVPSSHILGELPEGD